MQRIGKTTALFLFLSMAGLSAPQVQACRCPRPARSPQEAISQEDAVFSGLVVAILDRDEADGLGLGGTRVCWSSGGLNF